VSDNGISPTVLRGRAVDVPLRSPDGNGTEQVGIVFDCNVLADLEEAYGDGVQFTVKTEQPADWPSDQQFVPQPMIDAVTNLPARSMAYGIEAWQAAMAERPFSTLRKTMALALGISERECGARMLDANMPDYFMAIGAAFAIANGVDPTEALAQAQEQIQAMRASLGDAANASPFAIPGTPGPPPGRTPDDPLTSSGT